MADEYKAGLSLYSSGSHVLSKICDYIIKIVVGAKYVTFIRVYENAEIAEGVIVGKEVRPIGAIGVPPTFVAV